MVSDYVMGSQRREKRTMGTRGFGMGTYLCGFLLLLLGAELHDGQSLVTCDKVELSGVSKDSIASVKVGS